MSDTRSRMLGALLGAHAGDSLGAGFEFQSAAGNGSLMRCISTALMPTDPATRLRRSALISAITHDDPRCIDACVPTTRLWRRSLQAQPP